VSLDEAVRQLVAAEVERQLAEREELRAEDGNGWPEWLDVKTAARYLGCEVGVVRKLYERRKVPHYQDGPGSKVWLRRSELDAYMRANRISPRGVGTTGAAVDEKGGSSITCRRSRPSRARR
jgi:excisionase family DNA binding protein